MKKLLKFIPILSVVALVPFVAFAQGLSGVIVTISDLLGAILPVLISLGVVYFVWGVVQYVVADGEEAKKTGKDRMIYGIIGLAVIISIWGLVFILTDTFKVGGKAMPPLSISTNTCILTNSSKVQDLLCYVTRIINDSVIPLIFALATVMFIWGVVQFFIFNAGEEAKRAQGKQFMIWGIIALAVMISIWGLVGILGTTFGINRSILPQVCPPGSTNCP